MKRRVFPLILQLTTFAVVAALPVAGQEPAAAGTTKQVTRPALAGGSATAVSKQIRALLPNFAPTHGKTTERPLPKGAVMMPKVRVYGARTPTFTRRQILTQQEFSAMLRKEFPGASTKWQNPYHIQGMTPNYAALMYSEKRRKKDKESLTDFAERLGKAGDRAGEAELKKEIDDTFVRRGDWATESMDRSANDDRR